MSDFNQTKYINNYIKETYDIIKLQLPKGYKEKIRSEMKQKGFDSMNSYIKALIDNDIEKPQE